MTLDEARELISSPIWGSVRDSFLATGEFVVHPKGDARRVEYLGADVRRRIELWKTALLKAGEWRRIVDGAKVRELKAAYPGIYPEVFRYTSYFARHLDGATGGEFPVEALKLLLKLKFPEAYDLCFC